MKSVKLRIVESSIIPGKVSIRPRDDDNTETFRRALTEAGFVDGDLVELHLESDVNEINKSIHAAIDLHNRDAHTIAQLETCAKVDAVTIADLRAELAMMRKKAMTERMKKDIACGMTPEDYHKEINALIPPMSLEEQLAVELERKRAAMPDGKMERQRAKSVNFTDVHRYGTGRVNYPPGAIAFVGDDGSDMPPPVMPEPRLTVTLPPPAPFVCGCDCHERGPMPCDSCRASDSCSVIW